MGSFSGQGQIEFSRRLQELAKKDKKGQYQEEEEKACPENVSRPDSGHASPRTQLSENPIRVSQKHRGIIDLDSGSPKLDHLKAKQTSQTSRETNEEERRLRLESLYLLSNHVSAISCAHCQNVMSLKDFIQHQDDCLLQNPDPRALTFNRHNSSGSPFRKQHSRN